MDDASARFPRSSALAPLVVLDSAASTNDELLARVPADEFTTVVTTNQTAGRGRLGREWIAKPGQGLAASVLLLPRFRGGGSVSLEHFGWLPLIAGAAMTEAVAQVVPAASVGLKWPNDVLIGGLKVSGILSELLPQGEGVVIGSGVNLEMAADDLPTTTSTSINLALAAAAAAAARDAVAVADAEPEASPAANVSGANLADTVLALYLEALRRLYRRYLDGGADAAASGILDIVSRACRTLGSRVRVELPDGRVLTGRAERLDTSGRLIVRVDRAPGEDSEGILAVAAGDVTHLRYE